MQIKTSTRNNQQKRKPKPSHRKNGVCLATFSDLSQQIHSGLSAISCGSPDPHSDDFCALAYLSKNLLNKHPGLSGCVDSETRQRLAIAKLKRANDLCNQINEFGYRPYIEDAILNSILFTAKNLIGNLLKGFEGHCLQGVGFSNGASQGFKRQDGAPYKKFAGKATVTRAVLPLAIDFVKTSVVWEELLTRRFGSESEWFRVVDGNGLFTVPKNNEIDRAACKEPCMNMFFQRGVGSFIRTRLRTVGIDLNDQTRNNRLACIGSRDGSLATIDLSSASDSISDRLVWDLLPPALYSFLDLIRSKRISRESPLGSWKHALFSTMGNGFTFELESMIFWAIAKSCTLYLNVDCTNIGVYGDDIIVPSEVFPLLHDILGAIGFTLNTEKSFYTGYFRESCGKHFFRGTDVTPFYIKLPLVNIERLMLFLNRLRSWGVISGVSDPRLYEIWMSYAVNIPSMYYGGQDCNTGYSLVTGHIPRKELRPITVRKKYFDDYEEYGRLCAALSTPTARINHCLANDYFVSWADWKSYLRWSADHPESAKDAVEDNRTAAGFATKRNRSWIVTVPRFPQEILGTATPPTGYGMNA